MDVTNDIAILEIKRGSMSWNSLSEVDFTGDFTESESTSSRVSCLFGDQTFVHISWTQKTDRSFPQQHGSRDYFTRRWCENGRYSCLNTMGYLDLCPWVNFVKEGGGWPLAEIQKKAWEKQETPKEHNHIISDIDDVLRNVHSSTQRARPYIFEDNEVVIKTIIKGRSPDWHATSVQNSTC